MEPTDADVCETERVWLYFWPLLEIAMANYSVAEAKDQLSRLIERANDGEEVVITRHGKPVAEIRPSKKVLSPEERKALYAKMAEEAAKRPVSISAVDLIRLDRDGS
jgi:prevent-host-death family protein